MNKKIEEMARLTCPMQCDCKECWAYKNCAFIYDANILYKAGYRKADEVRKETAREILNYLHDLGGCGAKDDFIKGWDAAIDGAYKDISCKYGVEVEE